MKYAMESIWTGKIGFITNSPQETFGWFCGFLTSLLGTQFYQGNRNNGWRLVKKHPDDIVWKKYKPTKKIISQVIEPISIKDVTK